MKLSDMLCGAGVFLGFLSLAFFFAVLTAVSRSEGLSFLLWELVYLFIILAAYSVYLYSDEFMN